MFHLHGTPGCRLFGRRRLENDLDGILRSLGVRLVSYDRPGYGQSDRAHGRDVAAGVADVLAIADALDIGTFAVEGVSGGAPHALAVAALAADRVTRVACVAPMAPYDLMGGAAWSANQDPGVQEYVSWVLEGEVRIAAEFAREDGEQRAEAAAGDPLDADVFEQTRHGVGGWVDDELAFLQPWGFDFPRVVAPTQLWFDPNDPALPPQHAEWLARHVPAAEPVITDALGHGSPGDPKPAWRRLYSWLAGS